MAPSVIFKQHGTSVTVSLDITTIDVLRESTKEIQAIPTADHILIPLGDIGLTLTITGSIFDETSYNNMLTWKYGALLDVDTTNIYEIDPDTNWYVDKMKISRKGAYMNRFDYNITLIQVYDTTVF